MFEAGKLDSELVEISGLPRDTRVVEPRRRRRGRGRTSFHDKWAELAFMHARMKRLGDGVLGVTLHARGLGVHGISSGQDVRVRSDLVGRLLGQLGDNGRSCRLCCISAGWAISTLVRCKDLQCVQIIKTHRGRSFALLFCFLPFLIASTIKA